MLSKYKVTYDIDPHGKMPASHFITDDPIACETFLTDLLDRKLHIRDIAHEGVALPPKQFDEMLRSAVLQLASHHVCASLKISSDEAHVRFGLPSCSPPSPLSIPGSRDSGIPSPSEESSKD